MAITYIQSQVTKSATFVGSAISIASFVSDWTVKVRAYGDQSAAGGPASLDAGQEARIVIEESLDGFTTVRTLWVFDFLGGTGSEGTAQSVRKYEMEKTSLFGQAGAEVRANLEVLSAGSSITYEVWIEA